MKLISLATTLFLVATSNLSLIAADCNPLDCLLSKSKLVVVGQPTLDPMTGTNSNTWIKDARHDFSQADPGTVVYIFSFKVREVLAGSAKEGAELDIQMMRPGSRPLEDLPYLKKGQDCILFLIPNSGSTNRWETADPVFGIEPYNKQIASRVKVAAQKKPK